MVTRSAGAYVACGLLTVLSATVIAEVRPGKSIPSYLKTFSVLLVATALGLGASLIAGGTG